MAPLVSINLCCYNSEKYLRETLQSIINQTYTDWELVIINDGSSDSTESIVFEFINQGYPINYHYQENKGLGYSRNEALKFSNGEYIAFIDHDDIWVPEKLEKQVEYMHLHKNVGLCYAASYKLYGSRKTKILFTPYYKFKTGWVFSELLFDNFANLSTVLINRNRVGDELFFLDEFNYAEEYELFLRLSLKTEYGCIFEPLVYYRLHESNSAKRNINFNIKERELINEKYRGKLVKNKKAYHSLESSKIREIVLFYLRQNNEVELRKHLDLLRTHRDHKNIIIYVLIKLGLRIFLSEKMIDAIQPLRSISARFISFYHQVR